MKRKEFERTTPEAVGIYSESIQKLMDTLESGFTEMHGIQIMRHGKICAEGWWSPFAPGIRHNLMSVTKTYTATAIGIAVTENALKLTDRIVDIFPEESPKRLDELLAKLTVRDVLCMGCGMEGEPMATASWIRDFIRTPVKHMPGTSFIYNSMGSTLLGAIIKKLTGQGLHEYLKPKLFDKIGIDSSNLRWGIMQDGTEAGGVGLHATTEDNLRLMKLYADGGMYEEERILSEEYVKLATSKQIDTSSQAIAYPFAKDNAVGYGFQIWMCRPKGVYRADGAMGQFSIVCPEQDMIISITETGKGIDGPQKTLDAIWCFLDEFSDENSLPDNPPAYYRLSQRLSSLALARPAYQPFSPKTTEINARKFDTVSDTFFFEDQTLLTFCGNKRTSGISQFSFHFFADSCVLDFTQDGAAYLVNIATDGSRTLNKLQISKNVATLVYFSGAWTDKDTFTVRARWIETCFEKELSFCFGENTCIVTPSDPLMSYGPLGPFNEPPARAILKQ